MRKLLAKDIGPFTKILSKMDVKQSLTSIWSDKEDGTKKDGTQIGAELIGLIIENYHKVEDEFFAFLADLEGKTKDEISNMGLPAFIELVKGLVNDSNLPFFKSAVK